MKKIILIFLVFIFGCSTSKMNKDFQKSVQPLTSEEQMDASFLYIHNAIVNKTSAIDFKEAGILPIFSDISEFEPKLKKFIETMVENKD